MKLIKSLILLIVAAGVVFLVLDKFGIIDKWLPDTPPAAIVRSV